MEDWINDIYNRNDIDIIYMDFKAAFDKVPHKRLLKEYGILAYEAKYKNR